MQKKQDRSTRIGLFLLRSGGLTPLRLPGARSQRLDLPDHIREPIFGFEEDLIRDLPSMDLDFAWKLEGDPHPLALDGRNSDDADRILWIAKDDFCTFPTRDDEHTAPQFPPPNSPHPAASIRTAWRRGSTIPNPISQTGYFIHTPTGGDAPPVRASGDQTRGFEAIWGVVRQGDGRAIPNQFTASTPVTSGTCWCRLRSIPI